MLLKLITVAICLALIGCVSPDSGSNGTWRASVDNGDRPGIGIELTKHADTVSGRVFLLDPNRPHDFAAGAPRQMQIHNTTDSEIRFAVDWLPSVHDEMILRLNSPLKAKLVRGVLASADGSDTPREYEFIRTK